MVINEDIELGNSAIIRKNISKSFCYLEILFPTHFFLETILIFKEHTFIDEFLNKYHKKMFLSNRHMWYTSNNVGVNIMC